MVISYNKKYWLSFCGSYGVFAGIRKFGREADEIVMYQFNDAETGIAHFCYESSLDKFIKEAPSSEDDAVLKKIEETKQKLIDETRPDEQLDFFNMLNDDNN